VLPDWQWKRVNKSYLLTKSALNRRSINNTYRFEFSSTQTAGKPGVRVGVGKRGSRKLVFIRVRRRGRRKRGETTLPRGEKTATTSMATTPGICQKTTDYSGDGIRESAAAAVSTLVATATIPFISTTQGNCVGGRGGGKVRAPSTLDATRIS